MALGFVVNIDDMFASSIPGDIIENAKRLNDGNKLKLTQDYNTFSSIYHRLVSQKNKVEPEHEF